MMHDDIRGMLEQDSIPHFVAGDLAITARLVISKEHMVDYHLETAADTVYCCADDGTILRLRPTDAQGSASRPAFAGMLWVDQHQVLFTLEETAIFRAASRARDCPAEYVLICSFVRTMRSASSAINHDLIRAANNIDKIVDHVRGVIAFLEIGRHDFGVKAMEMDPSMRRRNSPPFDHPMGTPPLDHPDANPPTRQRKIVQVASRFTAKSELGGEA
jgi:hypothetical protein